jgi:hypothetical protein
MIIFEKATTPGRGDHTLVKQIVKRPLGEPIPVTVGRISKTADGHFAYYEPETNEEPKIIDEGLESLKKQVTALYKD